MQIIHLSAECYPVAKVGGLGDVVGALPKYLNNFDKVDAKVVMPYVHNKFTQTHEFTIDHVASVPYDGQNLEVHILKNTDLGFDLYAIHIEGFSHRQQVYGLRNDAIHFTLFQVAALNWINQWTYLPDVIHCHDFHTAFVPFLMQHGHQYHRLRNIPTVFTIHNGKYQGQMSWKIVDYFPWFDTWQKPLLEWNRDVNAMAAAIKCSWRVTTVSPQYMTELMQDADGLEHLFSSEWRKCRGILNGIDTVEWDPKKDPNLDYNYDLRNFKKGKEQNKLQLCEYFEFNPDLPIISFIGRFVHQKGVDVLLEAIWAAIQYFDMKANFLILGSGADSLENGVEQMKKFLGNRYNTYIGYNESLARKIYAGSDFMMMPSRFEPCGLNQFYAMRYGTLPVVRTVGGLLDSVIDYEDVGGNGIRFIQLNANDILQSFERAIQLFKDEKRLNEIKKQNMKIDVSWETSASKYVELYKELL